MSLFNRRRRSDLTANVAMPTEGNGLAETPQPPSKLHGPGTPPPPLGVAASHVCGFMAATFFWWPAIEVCLGQPGGLHLAGWNVAAVKLGMAVIVTFVDLNVFYSDVVDARDPILAYSKAFARGFAAGILLEAVYLYSAGHAGIAATWLHLRSLT